jgi:hypothetical protein
MARYFIYSPMGRTGSQRIQYLLSDRFYKHQVVKLNPKLPALSTIKLNFTNSLSIQNDKDYSDITVEDFQTRGYITSPHAIVHAHTPIYPAFQDWHFILSTRKDKSEQPMSHAISVASTVWTPAQELERGANEIEPFGLDVDNYIMKLDTMIALEREYMIKCWEERAKVTVIFMEDTVKDIESKLNITISEKKVIKGDKATISKRRPEDYIINYEHLKYTVYPEYMREKKKDLPYPI